MPFCPECRSEYVDSMAMCPVCNVPLQQELPADVRQMSSDELREALSGKELFTLRRGNFDHIRELHLLLLENQIANLIAEYSPDDGPAGHYTQMYDILVAEDVAQDAVALMEHQWLASHPETAEAEKNALGLVQEEAGQIICPACESTLPANAEECPECGLYLGPAGLVDEEEEDGAEE